MKKLPKPGKPKALATKHRSPIKAIAVPQFDTKLGSHIAATSYDPESGHLDVTFAGGRKYRYTGVSKEIGSGIAGSDSLGRYLHAHVIGKHAFKKLP